MATDQGTQEALWDYEIADEDVLELVSALVQAKRRAEKPKAAEAAAAGELAAALEDRVDEIRRHVEEAGLDWNTNGARVRMGGFVQRVGPQLPKSSTVEQKEKPFRLFGGLRGIPTSEE